MNPDRALYPRVSDILKVYTASDMAMIQPEVLAKAADRGTRVHALCGGYARKLWLPDIDEDCLPYFNSFKLWCDENVKSVILTEERLYDDDLKFTGQIDMLVETKSGSLALIDLKTSATESKSWPLQLAAYAHLSDYNHLRRNESLIIKLKKTGCKAKEIAYTPDQITKHWNLFKGAIDLYAYFNVKEVDNGAET